MRRLRNSHVFTDIICRHAHGRIRGLPDLALQGKSAQMRDIFAGSHAWATSGKVVCGLIDSMHEMNTGVPDRALEIQTIPGGNSRNASVQRQLEFPDTPSSDRRWSVTVGQTQKAVLECHLNDDGALLRVIGRRPRKWVMTEPPSTEWEIELRVRPPVSIRSTRCFPWPAIMFDPVVEGKEEIDRVFYPGLRMAAYLCFPRPESNAGGEDIAVVRSALREVQRHLRNRLVPSACRAASLFPADSSLRWDIYRFSAHDPTGRIAQLAATCPAALLRAWGLSYCGEALPAALHSLFVSGVRLRTVVDTLVDAWGKANGVGPDALRNQATRVLRAGPRVPLEVIWSPENGPGTVEDIPKDPMDNARWYLVFHEAERMSRHLNAGRQREGYLAFVSRHALGLYDAAETRQPGGGICGLRNLLEALNDYLRFTSRCPGRATNPLRLIEECEEWHRRGVYIGQNISPEQVLDAGSTKGFSVWETSLGKIRFIETVKDLFQESVTMHHCVASYAQMAVNGKVQLFHGDIDGETVTIEISCRSGCLQLGQVKGVANQEPGFRVRNAISHWLLDLQSFISRKNSMQACECEDADIDGSTKQNIQFV